MALKVISHFFSFIREKYFYIVLSVIVISVILGIVVPGIGNPFIRYTQFIIMVMVWAVCLRITPKELAAASRRLPELTYGLIMAYGIFPLLCYALAQVFMHDFPLYSTGFILMGVVPAAGMAAFWTLMTGGDVALALVLEAFMMVLGVITIPGLMSVLAGAYVSINPFKMFEDLLLLVLVPLLIGMCSRYVLEKYFKKRTKNVLPNFTSIAAIMAMLLMFISVSMNIAKTSKNISTVVAFVAPSFLLFLVIFTGTYLISRKLLRFSYEMTTSLVYSSSMKHLPLAMGIALMSFDPATSMPIAIAFIIQSLYANIFYHIFQRIHKSETKKMEILS